MTKGICLVHDLGLKKEREREREHPMYLIQYLHSKTIIRVPDPRPTRKLVGIMAQDSIQKEKEKKRRTDPEAILKNIQIYVTKNRGRKARNNVQQKEIELIQPKLSKKNTSKLAKKKKKKLRNKASQQRTIWRNSRNSWERENSLPFNLQVLQNFVSTS